MGEDLARLETESPNPNTSDIDSLSTEEILRRINDEDKKVAPAVERAIPRIAEVVEICVETVKNGGRIVYMGAGTSGRIAFVDAVETVPTFGVPEGLFIPLIAGGEEALRRALEAVEDDEELGKKDLEEIGLNERDVVVGITASGRTPYVRGGLEKARDVGAKTVLVCNVSRPALSDLADVVVSVMTGPEVITGSTRMKAGTAQKMVLNMISTATMIRLGKVYKNYMVDLLVLNEKLRTRAIRMVSEVTGVPEEVAVEHLKRADWRPKLAILMILSGKSKEECERALEGFVSVREALERLGKG